MSDTSRNHPSLRDLVAQIRRRFPRSPATPPSHRPEPEPEPQDVAAERARSQVEVIRRAFRDVGDVAAAGPEGPYRVEDDADALFLFRPGVALVRDDTEDRRYFQEFTDFFSRRETIFEGRTPVPRDDVRLPDGLLMVDMPARSDERDEVLATLAELDDERREMQLEGVVAQPDHVLYVTATGAYCPATEPEEPGISEPLPAWSNDASIGAEVKVSVVDTGLWVRATESLETEWLRGVTPAGPRDIESVDEQDIHEYAGHGTFVAGIIKCLAPGVAIEVEGALPNGGAAYESDIVAQLREALADTTDPQLISISAGTYSRADLGLLGFEILAENHGLMDGTKGMVIAAAGNNSTSEPFYPAAFPWVVGVGALDEEGYVADYSNYGCWVDVWARGSNLVNAFPPGTYVCKEPPDKGQVRHFKHLARWSGTSFSTPIVTAAIAAQMSATKNLTDPQRAFDEINADAPKCKDKIASGRKHLGPL
jgi:hypothetical protein